MLTVENITKRFSGVLALDDVSFELPGGKVTAIIGENGAGKSTLMKILSGVYQDFEGRVVYKGEATSFSSPREALDKGIAIIHQELNLIPELSITANIFLGRELETAWGTLDQAAMRKKTKALLDRLKLDADPDTVVSNLKVGQQQVVEIAKALLTDSDVIIMDEPTSAISESEVEVLFGIMRDLRNEGKAIVYISHKLDELFKIADRYVVLRDGRFIESGDMPGKTQEDIIQKMVGREVKVIRKQECCNKTGRLLEVQKLSLRKPGKADDYLVKDVSFSLCPGEILGIFGLMGAGRTELLEALFGIHNGNASGRILLEGREMQFKSSSDAIRAGFALVPEDRKKDGLVLGMDVKTNISITTLKNMERLGLLSFLEESELAGKYIRELGIKTSSESQTVKNLSGGNQQKVVLAKWLATQPKVLMLDEPTRGIDVNAKNEIYKLIMKLADSGLGIIMVSSELPEILAVSDRVLVMAEGRLSAQMKVEEASEDEILKAAIKTTI